MALAAPVGAETITGRDWQLLAIDGKLVEAGATLRIEADGQILGQAACNSYGSRTTATLPVLALAPIRATRMACPRLEEEQAFLDLLGRVTLASTPDGPSLILTTTDGQSLEFVADRAADPPPTCRTCPPQD